MFSAKASVLGVLLCLGFVAANEKPVSTLNVKLSGTVEEQWGVSIHKSIMSVTTHDESQDSKKASKYSLSLINMNNEPTTKMCELEFQDEDYDVSYPFTEKLAIVRSASIEAAKEQYTKYTIVSFPDCKTTPVKVNFGSYQDNLNSYIANNGSLLINEDDTFDVFYNDAKLCGNKVCRLTIDALGNKVKGPIASFVPTANTDYRFVKGIPSSSNFILTELKSGDFYKISLIKPDGQVMLKENKGYGDIKEDDVSTAHGSIRICSKTNTKKVDCEVFDHSGKSMSKISVVTPHNADTVTVENLADGDFLLSVENSEDDTLMRVKKDGSVAWEMKLSDSSCPTVNERSIDVSNDQFCVIRRCMTSDNLKIVKDCH